MRDVRKRMHARVASALLLLAAFSVPATEPDPAQQAKVEQYVAQVTSRLQRTPEQVEKLRPIAKERADKMAAIRAQHGGDTSRSARQEMFRDARGVQQEFESKVRPILTDAQAAEWEKMQAEARERFQEQMRARRAAE